jgi:ABC-type antimicrobial peptide transport system permease subunit
MRVRADRPESLEEDLRTLISQVDSRVAWTSLRPGNRDFEQDSKEMGYLAYAVGISGLVALVLSATGLYAVMSYVVTLRRREIGVRLAIGAPPARILSLMLRQSMRLVLIGIGSGLLLAVPLAFWLRAMVVIEANPDPMAFLPTVLLLAAVGAIAAALPALRASRVDPISTLRQD